MSEYAISQIYPSDRRANTQINELLLAEGIRRDANLDYTCGMYDDEMHIIATGSCFGNTLRCFAVSHEHQGEGLMNSIVSHLIEFQFSRGNTHLFLYTKCNSAKFFGDLGFYEIARIDGQIVFMENRKTGFQNYLRTFAKDTLPEGLTAETPTRKIAALVMNANPFANGSAIFTQSGYYARQFEMLTDGGMVGINVGIPVPSAYFPFSGNKDSFFGDQHVLGLDGVRFYTRAKTVTKHWYDEHSRKKTVDTWEGTVERN